MVAEIVNNPVVESRVAPVSVTYSLYALVARSMSVVPVSTIPAELPSTDVPVALPYVMDCWIPQYLLAGLDVVIGVYVIVPVYLVESVPPNVNSPLASLVLVVGSYDMPTTSVEIVCCANRLSETVGMVDGGDTPVSVPAVRSAGPRPRIPSTPEKPSAMRAPPDRLVVDYKR